MNEYPKLHPVTDEAFIKTILDKKPRFRDIQYIIQPKIKGEKLTLHFEARKPVAVIGNMAYLSESDRTTLLSVIGNIQEQVDSSTAPITLYGIINADGFTFFDFLYSGRMQIYSEMKKEFPESVRPFVVEPDTIVSNLAAALDYPAKQDVVIKPAVDWPTVDGDVFYLVKEVN